MTAVLQRLNRLRTEFAPMLALAIPVVFAELGWVAMGIVDTLMVGRLGAEAIGAVGIGSSVFMGVCVFAMGMLLGLDTLVSQSFGAGKLDECHRWLLHGVVLSLVLTVPVTGVLFLLLASLDRWGLDATVLPLTRAYLATVSWSLLPLLLYASFRRYLQATGSVKPVMLALILANLINVVANWILIFGKFGAPELGVEGSAWATVLSRIFMAIWLDSSRPR
jgi:MATE family multidrug resistance protein